MFYYFIIMNIFIVILFIYIYSFILFYFIIMNDRLCYIGGDLTIEAFSTKFLSQCLYLSSGRKTTC